MRLSLLYKQRDVNIITNDFITLNSINKFSYNRNIGDLIAILGSIDFVSGSVDLIIN